MDIPATLAYYAAKLGFACLGTWPTALSLNDPPVYAIVARDQQVIDTGLSPCGLQVEPALVRCAEPPTANPDKYADELLRVSGFVLTNPE
jgi:hypothetical protein